MNQPTTNSSFVNNVSAPSELPSLVAPSKQVSALPEAASPKPRKRKPHSPAKATAKEADRCRHYTSTGRRCRLAVLDPASGLCFRHVGRQFQVSDEDLSPAFLGLLSGFHSAARLHAFLTQLTVLLVQNRISTRRAAILAYLGQILLRNLPAINHEQKDKDKAGEDTDCLHLFPPHLQEIILNKRRMAQEAYARSISRQANSQPVAAAFLGRPNAKRE